MKCGPKWNKLHNLWVKSHLGTPIHFTALGTYRNLPSHTYMYNTLTCQKSWHSSMHTYHKVYLMEWVLPQGMPSTVWVVRWYLVRGYTVWRVPVPWANQSISKHFETIECYYSLFKITSFKDTTIESLYARLNIWIKL